MSEQENELRSADSDLGDELDTMLVTGLLRTYSRINPFINKELQDQNLTGAQLNALLVLRAAGAEGLVMGEIGRRLVVTKANVTGLIDRLERQGLVIRAPHQDRRSFLVRLTEQGAALVERAAPRHARRLADLTGSLSREEKETLIRLLSKLRRALRLRGKAGA